MHVFHSFSIIKNRNYDIQYDSDSPVAMWQSGHISLKAFVRTSRWLEAG